MVPTSWPTTYLASQLFCFNRECLENKTIEMSTTYVVDQLVGTMKIGLQSLFSGCQVMNNYVPK